MSVGLSKSKIASIITGAISSPDMPDQVVKQVAEAIAKAIDKNNQELEREFNTIRNLARQYQTID